MSGKDTPTRHGSDRFTASTETVEENLKRDTVGLVTIDEFRKRRAEIQDTKDREDANPGDSSASDTNAPVKKKAKKKVKSKLSFLGDEEEGEGSSIPTSKAITRSAAPADQPTKKVMKNPDVDTSYLPDHARDSALRDQREASRVALLAHHSALRTSLVTIPYLFHSSSPSSSSGNGKVERVEMKMGDTAYEFLERARRPKEMRGEWKRVTADALMMVKEDLVIPHHYEIHYFVKEGTKTKKGPFFEFGEDGKMDESDETRLVKVVEKSWYEKNKHIYPASKWEVFDPTKDYSTYTARDPEKNAYFFKS
ncbi:hypothetical protein YB2330_001113 [Saitoella coloradoensis]